MRIYSIASSNPNNLNINRTNNISRPAFKGKAFAKVLSEFRFKSFGDDAYTRAFNGFRYLMESISKEPNLQILKEDIYKELETVNTEDAFFDLLKNWHFDSFTDRTLIARDSEGPLIKYIEEEDKNASVITFDRGGKWLVLPQVSWSTWALPEGRFSYVRCIKE